MRWLPIGFAELAALAAIGMLGGLLAGGAGVRRRFPLWGFLVVFTASVVLFFVNARFRLPVLPVLMVYAGRGGVALWDLARERRWAGLAGRVVLAGLVFIGTTRVPEVLVLETEANGLLRLGQAEARAGRPGPALELYEQALELFRANASGDPDARGGFAVAVERAAHDALLALGGEHFGRREFDAAATWFGRALERSPRSFEAAFSLGKCLLETGDVVGARAAFEGSLEAGEHAEPRYLLEAYVEAARLAADAGDIPAAIATTERLVARFPDDPRAAALLARLRAGSEE